MRKAWLYVEGRDSSKIKDRLTAALCPYLIDIDSEQMQHSDAAGIVVLDRLDDNGCAALHALTQSGRRHAVVICADQKASDAASAWRILQAGADDILYGEDMSELASAISARIIRWQSIDALLNSPLVQKNLVGGSQVWLALLRRVVEVAYFTQDTVLIIGETGTGKELIARLIHSLDTRKNKPDLIMLDCTTLTPDLAGSELFGHERGAFTGAIGPRKGAFALADQGSLFLDELGELGPEIQTKLLRVIHEGTYKSVGGNNWLSSSFRLISATNRELGKEVKRGRFRSDLYHRVASWVFHLPPLRDRQEDILPLAEHFLKKCCHDGDVIPSIDDSTKMYLRCRDYPGNIRQLEHLMLQIVHRHVGGGPLSIGDVPEHERPDDVHNIQNWRDSTFDSAVRRAMSMGADLKAISEHAKDTAIRLAVADVNGNLQKAAKNLGVTDRTLQLRKANAARVYQVD